MSFLILSPSVIFLKIDFCIDIGTSGIMMEFKIAKEKILNAVWKLVCDKYALFKERDINWNNVLLVYKNKIDSVKSYEELYNLIDDMLLELEDPHTRVVYTPYRIVDGIMPLIISCNDNDFYVLKNLSGGKLLEGMLIESINDKSTQIWIDEFAKKYRFKSLSHLNSLFIKHFSEGRLGHNLKIKAIYKDTYIEENLEFLFFNNHKNLSIEPKSKVVFNMCQFRQYNDVMGYLHFISFRNRSIIDEFATIIMQLKSIKYLIIDIRGNDGGLIEVASKLASAFIKQDVFLGFQMRRKKGGLFYEFDKPSKWQISSEYELFNLEKIVVLCDEFTMSSAEFVFLRTLKTNNMVTVIGNKTGGLAHGASVFTLFDSSKIQITTSKYLETNGEVLKEVGIEPDIYVKRGMNCKIDKQLIFAMQSFNKDYYIQFQNR